MKRLLAIGVGTIAVAASLSGDSLVVTGTGSPGSWTTQIEMANPTSSPIAVTVYYEAGFQLCSTPACPFATIGIPANGTASLPTSVFSLDSQTEFQTIYITPEDGVTLPTVRAEAVDAGHPGRRNALSVIRLSTLNASAVSVLVFPGAARTSTSHTNLAVGAVSPDGTSTLFSIRLEVFSPAGTLLASGTYSNAIVEDVGLASNIFLGDVLGGLGVDALADGQLRVTKVSGEGSLWGELVVVHDDGSVEVSQGANP